MNRPLRIWLTHIPTGEKFIAVDAFQDTTIAQLLMALDISTHSSPNEGIHYFHIRTRQFLEGEITLKNFGMKNADVVAMCPANCSLDDATIICNMKNIAITRLSTESLRLHASIRKYLMEIVVGIVVAVIGGAALYFLHMIG